ncbi:MAG: hypothetical protein QM607_03725 [Microbacterium sp.]
MRWRRTLALAAAVLTAALGALVAAPASATDSGELSASGQEAITDLRTCLASNDTLNVYYLVDNSLSLETADDGGAGSDPDVLRASVLGNSLQQLGSLNDSVTINWAAGFFSSDFSAAIDWTAYDESSPDKLKQAIEQKQPGGYTNWPAALQGAQQALAAQQSSTPGCQMLIWLTDGQLDIQAPDGQQQEDHDALNDLCGATLDSSGHAAQDGGGVFNSLRQSGVVVVGALLAVDDASKAASAVMQPLVEGADLCGTQPMPDSWAHGLFQEASDADSLAVVFAQLSAQVAGGYPQPFADDGSFWIDEGVSRFEIVVAGSDWTLTPPADSGLTDASASAPQDWETSTSDGPTVIDVNVDADQIGQWKLTASNAQSLFLFSDLSIAFDESNSVELSADGTATASLNAQVMGPDGATDLSAYGDATISASYVGSDGNDVPLDGVTVDENGAITIPLPSDVTAAQLTVTTRIDPLVTREHQLSLSPVATTSTVTTVLPKAFPHVETTPVHLSDLEGSSGEATGTITLAGPEEGGNGTVCIGDATVTSDAAADRADDWTWTFSSLKDGCITVPAGGEATVEVSVTNPVAADSAVAASLPVTFISADGDSLTQDVPVEFRSTHPINTGAVLGVALVLILLGLLIPLLLLWLLNWLTTRIDVPQSTQRAQFPIEIAPAGARITAPAGGAALANAFPYLKPSKGMRSISDSALGTLQAKASPLPWRAPHYEIVPPKGQSIVTAHAGRSLTGATDDAGRTRLANLPLDRFWAVVVSDQALRESQRGDIVSGTVVIYHRATADQQGALEARIAEIEADGTLAEAVNRTRARVQGDTKPVPERTPRGPSAPPKTAAPAVTSSAPPLPSSSGGSSAPPPRPSSGSTPPPRPGSVPPPPRPGQAPPARPGA